MINTIEEAPNVECYRCGNTIGRREEIATAFLDGWPEDRYCKIFAVHTAFCNAKKSEGPIRVKAVSEISDDEWQLLDAQAKAAVEFLRVEPVQDSPWLVLDLRRLYKLASDVAAFAAGGLKLQSAVLRAVADANWRWRQEQKERNYA